MSFSKDVKFYNRFFVNLPFESKKKLYEVITRLRKLDLEVIEEIADETDNNC